MPSITHSYHSRTWLEIDLDALIENISQIKSLLPQGQILIATVKANAYGHGDHRIAGDNPQHEEQQKGHTEQDQQSLTQSL